MRLLLDMGLSNAVMATVLALVAAGVSHVCRRPALAHALWLLVLLKLATPAFIPVSLPWNVSEELTAFGNDPIDPSTGEDAETGADASPEPAGGADAGAGDNPLVLLRPETEPSAVDGEVEDTSRPAPASHGAGSWPMELATMRELLGPLWLAGSLLWVAWAGWHIVRFQRLLRHARRAPGRLQERVNRLAHELGLKIPPVVWLVPGTISPMLWAIGRAPRLLFPKKLLDHLDQEQQAALLVHELAHLKRRDHWVRFLELVVTGLYWWHPVVWWARREIHEAEEHCCDAWVVWAQAGAGRTYALALLQTVEFVSRTRSPLPVAASGIGHVPHLRRRLTMIMQGNTPRSLSWPGISLVLALGVALLPLWPVQAQPTPRVVVGLESDGKGDKDKQIEVLKEAIRILEAQKAGEKLRTAGEPAKVDPAEIQKAREEVERSAKELQAKQRELQEVAARHAKAQARLAQLQGGKAPKAGWQLKVVRPQDASEGMKHKLAIINAQELTKEKLAEVRKQQERAKEKLGEVKKELGRAINRPVVAPPKDGKAADIEQKLDRLLREVEELKRELRGASPKRSEAPLNLEHQPVKGPQPSIR
jgi:beta-lactamase regulating signal transducer with metallopeptidase domain